MGWINFTWLAVWVLSPNYLSRKLWVSNFIQALRWSRRDWRVRVRAVPLLLFVYPVISRTRWPVLTTTDLLVLQLRNVTEYFSQHRFCSTRVSGCSAVCLQHHSPDCEPWPKVSCCGEPPIRQLDRYSDRGLTPLPDAKATGCRGHHPKWPSH